jgi:hypothetical protein
MHKACVYVVDKTRLSMWLTRSLSPSFWSIFRRYAGLSHVYTSLVQSCSSFVNGFMNNCQTVLLSVKSIFSSSNTGTTYITSNYIKERFLT